MRLEAVFDCLTIISLVGEMPRGGPTKGEVHLLAYLASLLAVYARREQRWSDWGYAFTATPTGSPFSGDLAGGLETLTRGGEITFAGKTLGLNAAGVSLQRKLSTLDVTKGRFKELEAASCTLLAMPVGLIRAAFAQDPNFATVAEHKSSRLLVSEGALLRLWDQFDVVAKVLGTAHESLLAASVLWLTYLAEGEPGTAES